MLRILVGVSFGIALLLPMAGSAMAAPACKSSETFVPRWGCVQKKEIAKAIQYCKKIRPVNGKNAPYTECLCQDGPRIGACGN